MSKDHSNGEPDQFLEEYARTGVSTALSEQLGKKYFNLRLSPKAHKLLQDCADAHERERHDVIAFLIEWYGGPLLDTVPRAFRVSLPAIPLIERQPLSREESDRLVEALLVRFRRRENRGSRGKYPRHNIPFSFAMIQMLRLIAKYHGLYVNRIVETLICLVLPDPTVKPIANKSPVRRR